MAKMTDKEVKAWGDSIGVPNCDKKRNFLSVLRSFSSAAWGDVRETPQEWLVPCLTCKHSYLDTSNNDDNSAPVCPMMCRKFHKSIDDKNGEPFRASVEDDCRFYELDDRKL
jgi:hypothetical protein